ncbi:glycosyltransferase family 4 protein [Moorella sp. Hama-1]|uniref:glycosyltransferase family 4 protein n=1 Tax=Moorella sp. Hama-1 TaxID=2138101 RepID=UPI00128FF3F1|nr:glycosyltransferase family 4 protein [Moorella sp. Hama-1]BCV20671.1 hypothetical protein hamaS1_07400 [Moorella sp. Hama-1]
MAKVLILWQSDYPWDVRIDKMVRSLVSRRNRVTVLANNLKNIPREEEYLGARVMRTDRYRLPVPGSPYWIRAIEHAVRVEPPDVIIVRDLPLFHVAYLVAKKRDIPLWFDMVEDYPASFLDVRRSLFQKLTIKNYWLSRLYERFAVHRATVITVVCDESKERVAKLGVPESRIEVLENMPDRYFLSCFTKSPREHKELILVYSGNLDTKRGLCTVIDALALQEQLKPHRNIRLIIAGGTTEQIQELRQFAQAKLRKSAVTFLGKIPYLNLANVISQADWGIVPHLPTLHISSTMPNKIYDYMAVGTPVIVSDVGPLRRVVEDTGAGVIFRAGNANSFSQTLTRLLEEPQLQAQMSARALEAYKKRFNWEAEEIKLFRILESIRDSY